MSCFHPGRTKSSSGLAAAATILMCSLVAACGGGGGSSGSTSSGSSGSTGSSGSGGGGTTTPQTYAIGGSVSGLSGSGLVLQDNAGDNLSIAASATSFSFPTKIATGDAYAVTVLTSPSNPAQACTVTNGSGQVNAADVTNVAIKCVTNAYTIGGNVTGLAGNGLILQDNHGDNLTIAPPPTAGAAVGFVFATPLNTGATYAVTVLASPANPAQACTVTSGTGPVGSANITNVAITCVTNAYTIGGTVTGLAGSGLVLQDNNGDNLTVSAPSTAGAPVGFVFATPLQPSQAYAVTVSTQPTTPAQLCSVGNASGTVATANISNITVSCVNVGKFVFVANGTDGVSANGDVSAYTINPSNGVLTPVAGSPFAADVGPTAVAVDQTGQYVYVTNNTSSDVTLFDLDSTAGTLTFVRNTFSVQDAPVSIAVAPSNGFVYVGGFYPGNVGAVSGFTLNPASGALALIANMPVPAFNREFGIAVDPTSQLVFATDFPHFLDVYSIAADGELTATFNSPFETDVAPYGVAVWPNGSQTGGYVYTANQTNQPTGDISAFSYDSTGNLTELTTLGSPYQAGGQTRGVTIDPTGKFLYASNYADGNISAFSINGQTGALTSLGAPVATGNLNSVANPGPTSLKVDPSGQYLYCVNTLDDSVSLFTIQNGVLTLSGTYAAGGGAASLTID
jgi:6-phosphogluconolactonase (cycloisomerase 2 family)